MTTRDDIGTIDLEHLDHEAIEAHLLVEHYPRGTLQADVEMAFEAHLLDCAACQEAVEAQASFVRGLRTVAAEEAARTAIGAGLVGWLSRRAMGAVTLGLLLLATIAIGALVRQNSRLAELVAALDPTERPSTIPPGTTVPLLLLGTLRDGEANGNRIVDTGSPYTLALDVGSDPRPVSYTVTIEDPEGTVHWAGTNLRPNALEVVQLTFPSKFFAVGSYTVRLQGVLAEHTSIEIGQFALQIATTP